MNTDEVPSPAPTPTEAAPAPPPKGARYWVRRLLVCNPFFLCSAALLLFAINRLYNDPGFLGGETEKLLFNFSALQFYQLLLIGTAILLARRRIWYDSALLVVLDHGLILIPFMLISQADLIDNRLGWTLTIAGGLAAVARIAAVKRWYAQFNLPPVAIILGSLLLLMNVALPRVFRSMIAVDYYNWHVPNLVAWYVALPIIVGALNLLPRPTRYGGLNPERHWLPTFLYVLWAAGTGVHIWSVGHIAARPFQIVFLAPAAWAGAWTFYNRLTDFLECSSVTQSNTALVLAFLSPLVALGRAEVFTALAILNTASFGILSFRQATRFAKELTLLSALAVIAGMPLNFNVLLHGTRAEHLGIALAAYAIIRAIRSSHPWAGLIGAFATGMLMGWFARSWSGHAGSQAAFVFLLVHTLRWFDQPRAADRAIRNLAAVFWVLDALVWTREGFGESCYVAAGAVLVASVWGFYFWRKKIAVSATIPICSVATALSGPSNWFVLNGSVGLIALATSFALFAVGTALAITRHRWDRNGAPSPPT